MQRIDEHEARAIGADAYVFLYPLVLMDVSRRQATNAETAGARPNRMPEGTLYHMRAFPPPTFRDIVRPNFDTLYSVAWIDVGPEPVVLSVPDAGDRYYLMPLLDMWTEVFACPGTRTTGNGAARFAIAGKGFDGSIPEGVQRIDAPTRHVWLIGRTEAKGPEDFPAVHRFQDGLSITPLSRFGQPATEIRGTKDPSVDDATPPLKQVQRMPPEEFLAYGARLLEAEGAHFCDPPMLARLARAGFVAGSAGGLRDVTDDVRRAFEQGMRDGQARVARRVHTFGADRNGWRISTSPMGSYGANYLDRAAIAYAGLGANLADDAVYPAIFVDRGGRPLTGANAYVLRFEKGELPPARAFWSVTVYDEDGFPFPNPLGRCALGDRDPLVYGSDGSLEIHLSRESPGAELEANWLPTPDGPFNLLLRAYYPEEAILEGAWAPPAPRRKVPAVVEAAAARGKQLQKLGSRVLHELRGRGAP